MREEIADLVYPVLREGLDLKERLERGAPPDLAAAQARLNQLLRREAEAKQWPDFGGSGDFLGSRYGLACWLDELFSESASDWGRQWNNAKRETALYGSNDRSWKFWEQAQLAESRSEKDALEAFYLCAMLGFRGQLADEPGRLREWREAVERQLNQGQARAWPGPPELPPPAPNVPPLRGADRFRRVVGAALVAAGAAILALTFKVVSDLSRN